MDYPRFIYNNSLVEALLLADITAAAVDAGFSPYNVKDRREFITYKTSATGAGWLRFDFGSAVSISALALAGHTLATQGVTGVALTADNAGAAHPLTNSIVPSFNPATDRALAKYFTPASFRYWEISFTVPASAYAEVGVVFLAPDYLEWENLVNAPFDPDRTDSYFTETIGDAGHLLGIVRKFEERKIPISFNALTPAWVDANFWPFMDTNGRRPFFFSWDADTRPTEVSYVRIIDKDVTAPYSDVWRAVSLTLKGLFDAR